jgi:succinoglycan biosynthesis transport protein ExoP
VIDLRGLFGVFRRRAALVVATTVLIVAGGLGVYLSLPPRFEAKAQVLLDPQGLQVLQNDLTHGATAADTALAQAESQLRVITSAKVIEQEKLTNDPEFGDAPPGLLSRLLAPLRSPAEPSDPAIKALRILQSKVGAYRPDRTYVIEVIVTTMDPQKSARIANAIAETYIAQEVAAKSELARRTSASLAARLDELRAHVQKSEDRVEDYKSKRNIIGASGRLVSEQQLTEINNQLLQARARAAELAARYEDIRRIQQGRLEPGAIAEALQSPVIAALRAQYAEIKRVEADRMRQFGPRHPSYAELAPQESQIRRLINDEVARIAQAAQSDLNRARANQRALEATLESLKREAVATSQASVKLRELEREAESNRAVYEAFLKRTKELNHVQFESGSSRWVGEAARIPI